MRLSPDPEVTQVAAALGVHLVEVPTEARNLFVSGRLLGVLDDRRSVGVAKILAAA